MFIYQWMCMFKYLSFTKRLMCMFMFDSFNSNELVCITDEYNIPSDISVNLTLDVIFSMKKEHYVLNVCISLCKLLTTKFLMVFNTTWCELLYSNTLILLRKIDKMNIYVKLLFPVVVFITDVITLITKKDTFCCLFFKLNIKLCKKTLQSF